MSCVLRIAGEYFDVDGSLSIVKLIPHKIWHKNEPVYKSKPEGKKLNKNSCSFTASNADFNSFDQQVKETTNFLLDNYQQLQILTNCAGIEYAVLDFGVEYDESKFVQSKYLPIELVKLCAELNIGIELSIYAPASEE